MLAVNFLGCIVALMMAVKGIVGVSMMRLNGEISSSGQTGVGLEVPWGVNTIPRH